jgi:hypothetical protein
MCFSPRYQSLNERFGFACFEIHVFFVLIAALWIPAAGYLPCGSQPRSVTTRKAASKGISRVHASLVPGDVMDNW